MDKDLSDHGAVPYDTSLRGYIRDLPDVDLSDHGAIPYEPKHVTWGTNDEEIIKQIDILMHATFYKNIDQIVPLLEPESVAKIVNYRYRQAANILEYCKNGLSKDDKERLGISLYMDLSLIESIIELNPCFSELIFDPNLYIGQHEPTDIFGVLTQYQKDLEAVQVKIPLINGYTEQILVNENGKVITAQEVLDFLLAKKETLTQDNSDGMGL